MRAEAYTVLSLSICYTRCFAIWPKGGEQTDSLWWRKWEISLNELTLGEQIRGAEKKLNIVSPLTLDDGYFGILYSDGKHSKSSVWPAPARTPDQPPRAKLDLHSCSGWQLGPAAAHSPAAVLLFIIIQPSSRPPLLRAEMNLREVWSFTITENTLTTGSSRDPV